MTGSLSEALRNSRRPELQTKKGNILFGTIMPRAMLEMMLLFSRHVRSVTFHGLPRFGISASMVAKIATVSKKITARSVTYSQRIVQDFVVLTAASTSSMTFGRAHQAQMPMHRSSCSIRAAQLANGKRLPCSAARVVLLKELAYNLPSLGCIVLVWSPTSDNTTASFIVGTANWIR